MIIFYNSILILGILIIYLMIYLIIGSFISDNLSTISHTLVTNDLLCFASLFLWPIFLLLLIICQLIKLFKAIKKSKTDFINMLKDFSK